MVIVSLIVSNADIVCSCFAVPRNPIILGSRSSCNKRSNRDPAYTKPPVAGGWRSALAGRNGLRVLRVLRASQAHVAGSTSRALAQKHCGNGKKRTD